MPHSSIAKLTLFLSLLALAPASLTAQDVFGRNLVVNGDAESGPGAGDSTAVPVPDWIVTQAFTAVEYGAMDGFPTIFSPGPSERGVNLFAGGPVEDSAGPGDFLSTAIQMADVASGADTIDVGLVQYEVNAYLGGWEAQDDYAVFTVEFLSDMDVVLGSSQLGPVLALDRVGESGLLLRSKTGFVPIGTRKVKFLLEMTRSMGLLGEYNDGYADNLSLVFTPPLEPTEVKLTANDPADSDRFGKSVALIDDTALVGAPLDDDDGDSSGSAYVLVRDSLGVWGEQVKLTASDAEAEDQFGGSVALNGDTALIGAAMDDDGGSNSGSAYVFVRDDKGTPDRTDDTWSQQAKLTASDAAAEDLFGGSVALSGDTALVGAAADDDGGDGTGSAYVFVRDAMGSWSQQGKLTAGDAGAGDLFGSSVALGGDGALSGNRALIGAPQDDDMASDSGSAYVFMRDLLGSWSQDVKLTADDAEAEDHFGGSVSLSGSTALVGAEADDDAGSDSGSAYVFRRDVFGNWSQQAKLNPKDGAADNLFGASVAVVGDQALIGAPQDSRVDNNAGSAYVFVRNNRGTWRLQTKLTASDAGSGDIFGSSVSLSGNTSLVGAPGEDGTVTSGSAYVYETSVVAYGTGLPGSAGFVPKIGTGGEVPHVGSATFKIRITEAVGGSPCVVGGSLTRAEIPLLGGTLYGDFLTPDGFVALSFVTSGLAGFSGVGEVTVKVPIPNDLSLIGFTTYWQGFVSDTASPAPIGVTHTGGLAVTIVR